MSWENQFLKLMKDQGQNTDVRILEGTVTDLNPLSFKPDVSDREVNARFSEQVANGAFVGQQVLALQDMSTRRCYVISKLI